MRRRLLYLFPFLILVFSSVLSFWQPPVVHAGTSTTCTDWHYTDSTFKTICGQFGTYKWQDGVGYVVDGDPTNGCTTQIGVASGKADGNPNGILNAVEYDDNGKITPKAGNCADKQGAIGDWKDSNAADYEITIGGSQGSGTQYGFSSDAALQGYFVDRALLRIQGSGSFVDSNGSSIDLSQVNGYYYDRDIGDGTHQYVEGGDLGTDLIQDCVSKIDFNSSTGSQPGGFTTKEIDLSIPTPGGGCTSTQKLGTSKLAISSSPYEDASYVQSSDGSTIYAADADPTMDKTTSDSTTWALDQSNANTFNTKKCNDKSQIVINDGAQPVGQIDFGTDYAPAALNGHLYDRRTSPADNVCNTTKPSGNDILVVLASDYVNQTGGQQGLVAAATQSKASSQTLGCDYKFTDPLTWILCPVIQLFTRFAAAGDYIITQQLEVNSDKIFCNTAKTQGSSTDETVCGAYYSAWTSFRNIALGLMVIGGLVMLIAQGLGMEILDAYTLRKVLPRILIVAIGITLSWPLMQLAVTVANDLGIGIRALIYQPFEHLHNTISLSLNGNNGFDFLFGGIGAAAGFIGFAGWLLFGGLGILISLAGTAALAVLVAVFVLVLRQVAITMMIIVAPVAIVMFILPNTQKVYKIWWESFSKALLMFPLIAGMIASGRVFSAVANSQAQTAGNSLSSLFYGFAAFIAYFAPYFLIPATFKLAGGALRQIGGFVNDRSRGGFDRLRNGRANRRKKMAEDFGHRWRTGGFENPIPNSKRLGSAIDRLNDRSRGLSTGFKGRYGFGERGRLASASAHLNAMHEARKNPKLQAVAGWNDVQRILAESNGDESRGAAGLRAHLLAGGDDGNFGQGMTAAQRETEITRRVNDARNAARSIGFTKETAGAAFLNMAADGTAIRDVHDQNRLAAMLGENNRNNMFTLASEAAGLSKNAGRPDLAPASDPNGALVFGIADEMYGNGIAADGTDTRQSRGPGPQKSVATLTREAQQSATGGEMMYTRLANAKARAVQNDVKGALDVMRAYQESVMTGKPLDIPQADVEQAAATLMEYKTGIEANYGKVDNRKAAIEELERDSTKAFDFYMQGTTTSEEVVTEQRESVYAPGTPEHKAPVYASRKAQVTKNNKDRVARLVNNRMAGLSPQEKAEMAAKGIPVPEPDPNETP